MLLRPPLLVLGLIAPLGLLRWNGKLYASEGLLVLLAIFLSNAGFNVLNELRDVEVDRRKKPSKPLPSGRVSLRTAKLMIGSLLSASLIPSTLLVLQDMAYVPMVILAYPSGLIYNALRKDLVGNAFLGITYGMACLLCLYPHPAAWAFSAAFGLLTVAHNLMNQVQDVETDRGLVRTAPHQVGVGGARGLAIALSVLALGLFTKLYAGYLKLSLLALCCVPSAIIVSALRPSWGTIEALVRVIARLLLIVVFLLMMAGL
jgi:geranylgeranylglycerol-phosphate geranylgeranyltransferase